MYGDRRSAAYREGVRSFCLVAEVNKRQDGFMTCPCVECWNEKDHSSSRVIQSHLLQFGFMSGYNVWTKHGEREAMMEDGDEEENKNDNYQSIFPDTEMEDNEQQEEEDEERASDEPADDLGRIISDARLRHRKREFAVRADVTGSQQIVVPNL